MRYDVVLTDEALADYARLRAFDRAAVRDALAAHLGTEPRRASRSRIKKLRGLSSPQYRLRVGDLRVFYDVGAARVIVLAIVPKKETVEWLDRLGRPQ
jgi:mRNA-degrading endonuclease RelE of RelBE toxin-antitoxin system